MMNTQDIINEYIEINKIFGSDNYYNFMNHGYFPSFKNLEGYHKIFKYQSSLYLKLFEGIDITNKSVLDIGCGRGGGVDIIKQTSPTSKVVGLDINPYNINHCKNNIKGVDFIQANSQDIPLNNNTFDYIINVESSHCYPDITRFFNEVKRLLNPGGVFLYTDGFPNRDKVIKGIENHLPFKKIIKEDITKNVMKACNKSYFRWVKILKDSKAKNHYLTTVLEKYLLYKSGNTKYIIYTCYNE